MIQVRMGKHNGIDIIGVEGKYLVLDAIDGVTPLVHTTVEQDSTASQGFQQVAGPGDFLRSAQERQGSQCTGTSWLK